MLDNRDHLPAEYIEDRMKEDIDYINRFVYGKWEMSSLLKGNVFGKEHILPHFRIQSQ